MTQHQRDTYIDGREILDRAIRHLNQVTNVLDDACGHAPSERVRMLLASVEAAQRNVLGALERYRNDAPDTLLNTYAQYTVELPSEVEPLEEPLTTLSVTQWLLRQNGFLHAQFTELAEKGDNADSDERREGFAALAQQFEAHERRLSTEYQRFEDL